MRCRIPIYWVPVFLLPLATAQTPEPEVAEDAPAVVEAVEDGDEEEEETPVTLSLPTAEQIAALPAEQRAARAAAIKAVLLRQTLRMVAEEHRLTRENLADSAELARQLEAPAPLEEAFRLLASGELDALERRNVVDGLSEFYTLYGVDVLSIRLLAETAGAPAELMLKDADWLPLEHVFNSPSAQPAAPEVLQEQVAALRRVYTALQEQLATVQDTATADAAAEALLAFLPDMDGTNRLRMSPSAVQARAFAPQKEFFISTNQAISALRDALQEVDYYGSIRLRMVDYLLQ